MMERFQMDLRDVSLAVVEIRLFLFLGRLTGCAYE